MSKSLFALVCYTFGRKFSFEAEDLKEATALAVKWCKHHSFSYADEYVVVRVSSKENENGQFDFHPEYMK